MAYSYTPMPPTPAHPGSSRESSVMASRQNSVMSAPSQLILGGASSAARFVTTSEFVDDKGDFTTRTLPAGTECRMSNQPTGSVDWVAVEVLNQPGVWCVPRCILLDVTPYREVHHWHTPKAPPPDTTLNPFVELHDQNGEKHRGSLNPYDPTRLKVRKGGKVRFNPVLRNEKQKFTVAPTKFQKFQMGHKEQGMKDDMHVLEIDPEDEVLPVLKDALADGKPLEIKKRNLEEAAEKFQVTLKTREGKDVTGYFMLIPDTLNAARNRAAGKLLKGLGFAVVCAFLTILTMFGNFHGLGYWYKPGHWIVWLMFTLFVVWTFIVAMILLADWRGWEWSQRDCPSVCLEISMMIVAFLALNQFILYLAFYAYSAPMYIDYSLDVPAGNACAFSKPGGVLAPQVLPQIGITIQQPISCAWDNFTWNPDLEESPSVSFLWTVLSVEQQQAMISTSAIAVFPILAGSVFKPFFGTSDGVEGLSEFFEFMIDILDIGDFYSYFSEEEMLVDYWKFGTSTGYIGHSMFPNSDFSGNRGEVSIGGQSFFIHMDERYYGWIWLLAYVVWITAGIYASTVPCCIVVKYLHGESAFIIHPTDTYVTDMCGRAKSPKKPNGANSKSKTEPDELECLDTCFVRPRKAGVFYTLLSTCFLEFPFLLVRLLIMFLLGISPSGFVLKNIIQIVKEIGVAVARMNPEWENGPNAHSNICCNVTRADIFKALTFLTRIIDRVQKDINLEEVSEETIAGARQRLDTRKKPDTSNQYGSGVYSDPQEDYDDFDDDDDNSRRSDGEESMLTNAETFVGHIGGALLCKND